jgi:hypothetical protein
MTNGNGLIFCLEWGYFALSDGAPGFAHEHEPIERLLLDKIMTDLFIEEIFQKRIRHISTILEI